ncbi:hypothetical protein [Azospirillum doebereinerae]
MAAAASAMKERERDERDAEIARLKAKVGEITMANELLEEKIAALEGKRKRLPSYAALAFPVLSAALVQFHGSSSSMRVMGAHGLLAPHRVGRRRTRAHDGTIVTEAVNVMWGTDMTETITACESMARVFIAVDHANSEVVGVHASKNGNRFEALEPIRQGVLRHFGAIGPGVAAGLTLRHDHGSNYMSGDFQAEIKCLGITSSPSFVREPEGNGVAERFIRTLKENLLWVHTFDTVEELRRALVEFAGHYNETWLVARHGHRTPAQVRADQLQVDLHPIAELTLAA